MNEKEDMICGTDLRMRDVRAFGAHQLVEAHGDETRERVALCRYMKQGLGAGFTTGELIDWLGVSTPSVLDEAGIEDQERVMELVGQISDEEIANVRIGPKPHLP
jgi:hypothetical protein